MITEGCVYLLYAELTVLAPIQFQLTNMELLFFSLGVLVVSVLKMSQSDYLTDQQLLTTNTQLPRKGLVL